jgi:Fur family ferric uptake transcriptional regulator
MRMVPIMKKAGLTQDKLRMTRQRKALLQAIGHGEKHPTADEVYRRVRTKLPHISLATVYRNLEVLTEHGLVQRLDVGGSQRRFDAEPGHHHHVRCLECGRVEDVRVDLPQAVVSKARRGTDYRITGHRLEFVGQCGRCKREGAEGSEGLEGG